MAAETDEAAQAADVKKQFKRRGTSTPLFGKSTNFRPIEADDTASQNRGDRMACQSAPLPSRMGVFPPPPHHPPRPQTAMAGRFDEHDGTADDCAEGKEEESDGPKPMDTS